MKVPHVHSDLVDLPGRVRAFEEATAAEQLAALAELHRRASGQSPSTWSNGLLAIVPTLSLFGTMLLAAYGIWAQGGLAYWNLYATPIEDEEGWSTAQTGRWTDAITSIIDDPNALASGLIWWAQGIVFVLLVATFIAIALSVWSSRVRGTSSAWIAVYERALDKRPAAPSTLRRASFLQRIGLVSRG